MERTHQKSGCSLEHRWSVVQELCKPNFIGQRDRRGSLFGNMREENRANVLTTIFPRRAWCRAGQIGRIVPGIRDEGLH